MRQAGNAEKTLQTQQNKKWPTGMAVVELELANCSPNRKAPNVKIFKSNLTGR